MDIIMIGNAGASGTVKIAQKKYLELKNVYPEWFVDQARNIQQDQTDEVYKRVEEIVDKTAVTIKNNDEIIPLDIHPSFFCSIKFCCMLNHALDFFIIYHGIHPPSYTVSVCSINGRIPSPFSNS